MKRKSVWAAAVLILCVALTAALGGCTAAPKDEDAQSAKGIMIEKLDDSGEREFLMEDDAAVKEFFEEYFHFPETYRETSADGLTKACSYVIWQDKTILAGETAPSGMERILEYTFYKDADAATVQVLSDAVPSAAWVTDLLRVSYAIDAETAEFLKGYDGT